MNQLVSVIIPCYNDYLYIEEAIASINNQTYTNIEIIIIDDGSNLKTKNVLKNLVQNNLQLLTQENNGPSSARNLGIHNAIGNYILTLDADDLFAPTFIEKAVEVLEKNPKIGIVTCGINCFTKQNGIFYKYKPKGGTIKDFMYRNSACGNSMYRKECWSRVGGYDEKMKKGYEDWEYHVAITKNGWDAYVINEYLFNYRNKQNSVSEISNKYYEEMNTKYVFLKHNDVYENDFEGVIDYLIKLTNKYKNNEIKRLNSIDYRMGKTILKPLRFIKKFFVK